MTKSLVIVESPAKAKTIAKILGKGCVVKSSVGHVRDLPVRTLGVDVKDGFKPTYVMVKGRKKVVAELKKAAKEADKVYLAPDPDREGEAIAWHLREILDDGSSDEKFCRIQYNEITPRAVKAAFDEPGELDMPRVEAQQARRLLDRIVGYMVSPMLWRRIRRGLSAGRVQSVALRLVCEREAEIRKFVPEPFWVMGALVRKLIVPLDPFEVKLVRIDGEKADVTTEEQAKQVSDDLEGRKLVVGKITRKDVTRRAPPPFITSTLQQAASNACGFSPKRTMALAQRLYEGVSLPGSSSGLITYMRTDSFNISRDAQEACRAYVTKTYGEKFCPEKPNTYRSRSGAQEAHEAIRPTDIKVTPESVKGRMDAADLKLYALIWKRFVASQMSPAIIAQRTIEIDAQAAEDGARQYTFQTGASEVKFAGYMEVAGTDIRKPGEKGGKQPPVPSLAEGEPLICVEWLSERKETQPPARYSETSLVGALEKNGIGRPSTYAQILSTLQDRDYVKREKRTLFPTDLGESVNKLLVEVLSELFNVKFTAAMEAQLDEVEKGNVNWSTMLGEFYEKFDKWMEETREPPIDEDVARGFIKELDVITEWAPPVKRGKRTFSDERFVQSVLKQLDDGKRPVSARQFEALLQIGVRYRTQVPDIERVLTDLGRAELLDKEELSSPRETTTRKLDELERIELDESAAKFVASLRAQVTGRRRLSPAQIKALNHIFHTHAKCFANFDELCKELGIEAEEHVKDNASGPLLEAMSKISEWKEPVKRRGRTYDDKSFYESLSQQFARKGYLSPKQQGALKRMANRYKEEIPNLDSLVKADKAKPEAEGADGSETTD